MTAFSRRLWVDGWTAWIGILSEEGLRALRRGGHEAVAGRCAPDLRASQVRFVDESLRELLASASDDDAAALYSAPFPARPCIAGRRIVDGHAATIDLRIPPDLDCLRGHFPELPVVPGAAQLGWALEFGAEMLGVPATVRSLRSVKFERIIQPGRAVTLELAFEPDSRTLRFQYASASGRHSAGRIETRDDA